MRRHEWWAKGSHGKVLEVRDHEKDCQIQGLSDRIECHEQDDWENIKIVEVRKSLII